MAELVYVLCALMSLLCVVMLFRGFCRSRSPLLAWSCLCFVGLFISNGLLLVDMVIFPNVDFSASIWRNLTSAISGSLLLFGLMWEMS